MRPFAVPLNARLAALVALGDRLDAADMTKAPGEALRAVVPELGLSAGWIFLTETVLGDALSGALSLADGFGLPPALAEDGAAALRCGGCECQRRFREGALAQGVNMVTCSRLAAADGRTDGLELRALIETSRSPDLSAGLVPALARLAERMAPSVTVQLDAAPARPTPNVAEALYRLAQEAVHNAVRHGEARRLRIALERPVDGALRLSVQDDGHGCDPEIAAAGPGLHGAKGRIASLGGALRVARSDRGGLRVVVEIPASARWADDVSREVA